MKTPFLFACLAGATLALSGCWSLSTRATPPRNSVAPKVMASPAPIVLPVAAVPTPTATPSDATISLTMVGDILPLWVKDPLRDAGVRAQLSGADIAFANLESPLSTRGQPSPLKFRGGRLMHREFIFGASVADAQMLKNAGIDVVSLANNHMMDYGQTALADTLNALQQKNILTAGGGVDASAARAPAILERRGLKIAFLAYVADETLPGSTHFEATPQTAGVAFVHDEIKDGKKMPTQATRAQLRADIAAARGQADVVAVSFHWGTEFREQPNDFQRALAHFVVDEGADLVIGHHPHCLQGVELYQNKPIFYSLGNFVFHSSLEKSARSGIVRLEIDKDGVQNAAFHPVWVWDARPQSAHPRAGEAATKLRQLSQELGTPSKTVEQNEQKTLVFDLKPNAPPAILANATARSESTRSESASRQDWVEVQKVVAGLIVERPYASTRNVFKTRFYSDERALLRRGTALKLRAAQQQLAAHNIRLKLWDGYRPPAVQRQMWNQVRDARYVADPDKGGSRHNRGCAVDVTLADASGRELEMPTGYDDFSTRAQAHAKDASPTAKANRERLQNAMIGAGFKPLATEWWHFDDSQCAIYPIEQQRNPAKTPTKARPKLQPTSVIVPAKTRRIAPKLAVKLNLKRKFEVATGPKSLRVSPTGHLIVVNNLYAHCITLVNPRSGQPIRRIAVPGEAVECCFTQKGKKVWVSLYDKKRVVVIDLLTNRIVAQIPTGEIPKVVEASPDGNWVYAANWSSQSITVMDARQMKRVKEVKVGRVPRGIAFTRDGRFAYVANMGADSLSLIDVKNGHRVIKTIAVGANPRHLVLSRDGRRLYISHNALGLIRKLDTATNKVLSAATVGRQPRTIALSRDGSLLYVCNYEDNNVGVVDVTKMRQISTTLTSVHPVGATVAADGTLWISNYRTNLIMQFAVQKAPN